MINRNRIRHSMTLYLPDSPDWNPEKLDNYLAGQEAIEKFLQCEVKPGELVEILGDLAKVDIPGWLDCVSHNLNEL
jgi:hypothetical protein